MIGRMNAASGTPTSPSATRVAELPAFGFRSIATCAISKLARAYVLGDVANPVLHVVPLQLKRLTVASYAAYNHMKVWMLCIVMRDRDPFEIGSEIVLHLSNQVTRQSLQINSVAELGR